jgi:hypothetical protein
MKHAIKIHKIGYVAVLAALLTVFPGCTKRFNALNTPQNQIVEENIDANLLGQEFAFAQYNTMGIYNYSYLWYSILYSDRFAQYTSNNTSGFLSDEYVVSGTHVASLWTNFYGQVAAQIYFVEQYSQQHNMPLENAIAKILRVKSYQPITDHFGPIIYSQFGNSKTTVNYDSQLDIYTDFFKTLDSAVAVLALNPGKNAFGNNDQMYNGNVDQWRIFANSLRLRLAMRIVYANPALAQQEAEKAVAAGVMTSNSDNGYIYCTVNSLNCLSTSTYHDEWRMSASLYSVLAGYNDPRLAVYLAPRWDGLGYRGLRNGLPVDELDPTFFQTYSAVGNRWRPLYAGTWGAAGDNEPMPVITSAEVYFLMAEGALRGWNMGGATAANLYNNGITMSLSENRVGASPAQINTYINSISLPVAINDQWNSPPMCNIPVSYQSSAGFETQLEQIITQKWLALFPNGWEAWAERRRTGYPLGYALIESLNPNLTKFQLIRRMGFSPDEQADNPAGLKTGLNLLGGPDQNDTRVWWDAKPLGDYRPPTN